MRSTLLIVDDEPANIKILTEILHRDYELLIATDGERAIEIAKSELPECILLDVEMPIMDGYAVCKKIKEIEACENIPIIFVTAKSDDEDEEYGFSLGAVDYIKKPYRISSITARINTHLKLYEQEKLLRNFNDALVEQVELEVANRMKAEAEKKAQDIILMQQTKLAETGEMLSAIAHQWKQPLNTISLLTGLIYEGVRYEDIPAEELYDYCDSINEQVQFMAQTVNDFRNFLSPNKEKAVFNPKEAMNVMLRMIGHQLKKECIATEISRSEAYLVYGMENELKQVFLNLLKNSKDAFGEEVKEKRIAIDFFTEEDVGRIVFCDNAGGIPAHLLPDRLFESYVTTKGEEGTGIGLQISKRIIEQNFGGKIVAYNTHEGACFEISLPLAKR